MIHLFLFVTESGTVWLTEEIFIHVIQLMYMILYIPACEKKNIAK